MKVSSHLVVDPPPLEDSVLGWYVVAEGNTRLGQILAQPVCDYLSLHKLSEFAPYTSSPVDRKDEPLFALTVGEYCEAFPHLILLGDEGHVTETCTQEQLLTRLLHVERHREELRRSSYATYYYALQRRKQERSAQKLPTEVEPFLDALAHKMGLPRNWREVDVDKRVAAYSPVVVSRRTQAQVKPVHNEHPITPYDVRWDVLLRKKVFAERLASYINWCPTCRQYVAWSHDGPSGVNCEDHLSTLAEKRAVKLANSKKKKNGVKKACHAKQLAHPSRPKYRNLVEDRMARCFDAAFKRWMTERKMVANRHPNAPPKVRSLEKIVSESRYFPI